MSQALEGIRVIDFAQPIVAVAVAEDPACVDMVDGHLIENRHVDDARRVLAWADAIAERATHRLTLRRQALERLIGKVAAVTGGAAGIGEATVRWPSALAARSARASVGARSGGDEGPSPFLGTPGRSGVRSGALAGPTRL